MTSPKTAAPFKEGDLVRIKGAHHLGEHQIYSIEWFEPRPGGAAPYWLCEAAQVREPIDWSQIPSGSTGIVTGAFWRGSSEHLELAQ